MTVASMPMASPVMTVACMPMANPAMTVVPMQSQAMTKGPDSH
jgi:hypothetical protein